MDVYLLGKLTRPAWIEIDLDNLIHNYKEIRKTLKEETKFVEAASKIGQISAAVQCMFTKVLPRIYIKNNEIINIAEDYSAIDEHIKDRPISMAIIRSEFYEENI